MYFNEKHKERVENRGDGYTYIGSYRTNEITIDGKKSKSHIRVKCPYCGKEYDVRLEGFNKGNKCNYCCNYYEKSLAYYIQQELKEPLNKYWDWKRNNLNPYLIYKGARKIVYIKCIENNQHGSYKTTCDDFYLGYRCPYCSHASGKVHPMDSFGQWAIDNVDKDFMKKYWSPKNTIDPFEIAPQGRNTIYILCQEYDYHNDNGGYKTTPLRFYYGNRCSYCGNHKVHPLDSFGYLYPEKAKYWSSNNDKSPFEVAPKSHKKYKFICEECGKEFERSLAKLNRADTVVFCRECNSSQLEIKTKEILIKYNVEYKIQIEYEGLIGMGNGNLSYDFYLPSYNTLIECQGIQHEKFTMGLHKTKEDFKKQLEHDKRKRNYAKEHNINLLEIWYYDIDNIEEILTKELNKEVI